MYRTMALFSLLALSLIALPLAAQQPPTNGADKLGWKLALQSWTVHGTVFSSIDKAREIGVKYIEIYPGQTISDEDKGKFGPGMSDEQIQKVLEKAKSCNVQIIDFGVTGIPAKEADARKVFDWAKKVGLITLVAEPEPAALPMIDKLAGEFGIKVAIHDHPKPARYWNPEYVYGLTRDLKNIGFCADTGHWARSGLDPVDVLKKYGDKVVSAHFKDLVKGGGANGMHDVVWGTGDNHAAEMLAILKDKGFKGPFAIEFEWKWDVPTLQKCVEFFNQQADKLAAP